MGQDWSGQLGAGGGAVAFVVGGFVQGGHDGADLGGRVDDGVLICLGCGGPGFGRHGLVEVGAVGGVAGAFVDVGEVADHADGLAGVLVVVLVVAVAFQDVQDLEDEAPGHAVIAGHVRFFRWWRAGGRMSGAVPVPVAGFQPYWGR